MGQKSARTGLFLLSGLLCCVISREISSVASNLPCNFTDSVNITEGIPQSNKSIFFNGIEFLENNYAEVDYILQNGKTPIKVKPHIRGCPCKIRNCVRLCCPFGSSVISVKRSGEFTCSKNEAAKNIKSKIVLENNQTAVLDLPQHFYFIDRVCKRHFYEDKFQITYKGDILFENQLIGLSGYCLEITGNITEQKLIAWICFDQTDYEKYHNLLLPYAMIVTVPLIVATILIYICTPKLMNLFGRCLVCYLTCQLIYYIPLSYAYPKTEENVRSSNCTILAYVTYFAFISGLLWLNVISFDLWLSFRSNPRLRKYSDRIQFILYSIYVWSLSILLTAAASEIDRKEQIQNFWKPGLGTENCFLREESRILYFHLPFFIIVFVNIVFYILIKLKILEVKRNQAQCTQLTDLDDNYTEKQCQFHSNYALFSWFSMLIIFIWSMDAITLVSPSALFVLLSDAYNISIGIFIFILFVIRRRKFLNKKRCQCASHQESRTDGHSIRKIQLRITNNRSKVIIYFTK